MTQPSVLGDLDPDTFLRRYWQKQPALLRGALRAGPALEVGELLSLATRADVESRLVTHRAERWELELGPLPRARIDQLPERDWTLLVSDLEQHLEAVRPLLAAVAFLPRWRVDDVMASLAAPGGSVGPHFDSYDVFLVQLTGHKHWRVTSSFDRDRVRDDCELCILETFTPEQEWTLGPGDVLYLPPNVAHYGVAQSSGITLSVGCRTPSQRELLTHFAIEAIDGARDEPAYADPHLTVDDAPHTLRPDAVRALMTALHDALQLEPTAAALSLARLLTQPKALFAQEEDEGEERSAADVEAALGSDLRHARGSRWLAVATETGSTLVVNGRVVAEGLEPEVISVLCAGTGLIPVSIVTPWKQNEARSALLRDLVRAGLLVGE